MAGSSQMDRAGWRSFAPTSSTTMTAGMMNVDLRKLGERRSAGSMTSSSSCWLMVNLFSIIAYSPPKSQFTMVVMSP